MAVDGSIIINTKLDTSGVNRDMGKMSKGVQQAAAADIKKLNADIKEQEKTVASLAAELERLAAQYREFQGLGVAAYNTDALDAFRADKVAPAAAALDEATAKLDGMRQKSAELTAENERLIASKKRVEKQMKQTSDVFEKSGKRIAMLARRVFLYSIVLKGLHGVLNYIKRASSTSTELTNALARMRGALMTAFQPIWETILPHLVTFVNILTKAVMAVAALFSWLAGKNLTTSAKNAENLNNQADAIEKTGKAADKAKKSLAAFDEINNITSPAESGGSGGKEISPIFDAIKPPKWLSDLMKKFTPFLNAIKKHLKGLIPILKTVGALFLAAFAISKLAALAKALGKAGLAGALGKVVVALKAFALGFAVGGIVSYIANILAAEKGVKTLGYAITGATVALGGIITAIGISTGSLGAITAGIGLAVGAIAGLILAQKQLAFSSYQTSDTYKVVAKGIEESRAIIERSEATIGSLGDDLQRIRDVDSEWASIKSLTAEIFDLSEKSNKTAYEMALMETKVDILNGMNIEGLRLSVDTTTGTVLETRDAIEEVIASLEKQARMAALQDVLTEAYKKQYQAAFDVVSAKEQMDIANLASGEAVDRLGEALGDASNAMGTFGTALYNYLGIDIREFSAGVQTANAEVKHTQEYVDEARKAYESASGALKDSTEYVEAYTKELVNAKTGSGEWASAVEADTDLVKAAFEIMGKDAPAGAAKGITDNAYLVEDAAKQAGLDGIQAFADAQQSHSPAKKYIEQGMYAMQGLEKGICGNAKLPLAAQKNLLDDMDKQFANMRWVGLDAMFNGMIERFNTFFDRVRGGFNDLLSELSRSTANISPGSVPPSISRISIPRLAQGTVVPRNKPFAAMLGDNKTETEVVSPLSTMKQALLEALMEAGGGDINLTVLLDSDVVHKSVVKRNNQAVRRTGRNPLLGV